MTLWTGLIETMADETWSELERYTSHGVVDCVPSGTVAEDDRDEYCECVVIGNLIGKFI